jgi:hypothetical protein
MTPGVTSLLTRCRSTDQGTPGALMREDGTRLT